MEWTEEEIDALLRIVKMGRLDSKTIAAVFPYRSVAAVRKKWGTLKSDDPSKWTPPVPDRGINWDRIEIMEQEWEQET